MLDLITVISLVVFFSLGLLYVQGCAKLKGRKS